jgi:hypothetical protein
MNRRSKTLQGRNSQIYAEYIAHFQTGMPLMLIYATIGEKYDLGEESVRKIVAQQSRGG